jgi:hypothetical protein
LIWAHFNFYRCQIWFWLQWVLCLFICQVDCTTCQIFQVSSWFIFWWKKPSMWIFQACRLWCYFYYWTYNKSSKTIQAYYAVNHSNVWFDNG